MMLNILKEKYLKELQDLYPPEEIKSFFYLLCEEHLHKSRFDVALDPGIKLSDQELSVFEKALGKLKLEYPIQYLLGTTRFMGTDFEVNEHVLIPRPETEELVKWILDANPKDTTAHILDIGTGSGCIPVVLAKHLPEATLTALDLSAEALQVAMRNAKRNLVEIDFIQGDALRLDHLPGTYEIIVSNPPYVRESEKKMMRNNVLNFEPHLALYVPDDDPLLFYRHISKLGSVALKPGGSLYFEINQYLGGELLQLLDADGYTGLEIKKDIYGADRMIRAWKK